MSNIQVMNDEERVRAHTIARLRYLPTWQQTLTAVFCSTIAFYVASLYVLPYFWYSLHGFLTLSENRQGFTWVYLIATAVTGITFLLLAPFIFNLVYGNKERKPLALITYIFLLVLALFAIRYGTGDYRDFAYVPVGAGVLAAAGILRSRWFFTILVVSLIGVFAPIDTISAYVSEVINAVVDFVS